MSNLICYIIGLFVGMLISELVAATEEEEEENNR